LRTGRPNSQINSGNLWWFRIWYVCALNVKNLNFGLWRLPSLLLLYHLKLGPHVSACLSPSVVVFWLQNWKRIWLYFMIRCVFIYIYIHLFISFQEGAVTARGPNLFCCYFFLFLVEFDIKSLRIYQMIFYDDFENVIITGISIMLSKLLIKVSVYTNINVSINDCQVYLNGYSLWSYRLI